jgi:molecular chaperone GrpE
MEAVGQPFDSDLHEAIAMVPGQPEDLKGKVMDCMIAGYILNDKVIRYAKVAVAE